ncbi:Putative DNA-binding protein [Mycobacteroides abscessus subsp. massiliense]|uniref:DNA-binding protein n=1 Tax=Mycobacteroides abscessus TaxID=36809 RepID=UPI0009A5DAC8|nr:DNA-binding protein [Mycobacteroides abscessus]RIU30425.1 DNA-binding protein [Mycobacteroides abscessus]SKE94479.1 Putative DNA-binding protein [Mycobacteroides abscessus subsp. massiliense]SKF21585.1 Putative DNA-binding protein [Mycobacteroides abscessus subsp. massiliense]SKF89341.1 Putative DNA-binding protein [Mycobacteroides abscessus subsp. massiliense]SKG48499.1 Putative DNA-binding protein [Mycobacteroides abscessus subsp. massiliense]
MVNDRDDNWASELVKRVGKAMKEARGSRSATWLSERTAELGYRVPATVISKLDSGWRGSVLSVPELVVLAAALDMAPVALLYPTLPDGKVELLPGKPARSLDAVEWFCGHTPRSEIDDAGDLDPVRMDSEVANLRRLRHSRIRESLRKTLRTALSSEQISQAFADAGEVDSNPQAIRGMIEIYQERLERMEAEIAARGWDIDA